MPLTAKGREIEGSMEKTYGSAKKAEQVLYASKNAGKITGIDGRDMLERAVKAGQVESEAQRQAKALLEGKHVSGRDRARLKR